jgi:hypothetical protein
MGQKTHPLGFRLGVIKDWRSRWYAEKDFPRLLKEDETIRLYLHRRLAHAALSHVEIERKPSKIVVTLHTGTAGRRDRQARRGGGQAARRARAADQGRDLGERRGDQAARGGRAAGRRERGPSAPPADQLPPRDEARGAGGDPQRRRGASRS